MKFKFILLTLLLMVIMALPVSAAGRGYTVEFPEDYVFSYGNAKPDSVAQIIGMDSEKFSNYFKSNGLLFIAVKEDNSVQIRFSKYSNEFSQKLGNMENLNDKEFSEIASKLAGNKTYEKEASGEQTFICIKENLKDSGGEYVSTQYITVKNGNIYQLSCYNNGSETEGEITEIFNSLSFSSSDNFNWLYTMIFLAVIILGAVIIIMVKGIVTDLRK